MVIRTEELLDYLAEQFQLERTQEATTFENYVEIHMESMERQVQSSFFSPNFVE